MLIFIGIVKSHKFFVNLLIPLPSEPKIKTIRSLFFKSENFEIPLLSKPTIVNPFSLNFSKDLAIFVTLIKGIFSLAPTDIFEKLMVVPISPFGALA